ncbi:hypothetical protein C5H24_12805, partial [Xylella fastidiosa]
ASANAFVSVFRLSRWHFFLTLGTDRGPILPCNETKEAKRAACLASSPLEKREVLLWTRMVLLCLKLG